MIPWNWCLVSSFSTWAKYPAFAGMLLLCPFNERDQISWGNALFPSWERITFGEIWPFRVENITRKWYTRKSTRHFTPSKGYNMVEYCGHWKLMDYYYYCSCILHRYIYYWIGFQREWQERKEKQRAWKIVLKGLTVNGIREMGWDVTLPAVSSNHEGNAKKTSENLARDFPLKEVLTLLSK